MNDKPENKSYNRKIFFILIFFMLILLLYLSRVMSAFLVPVFLAFFSSLVMQPFILKLTSKKVPAWLAILIVVIVAISILSVFVTILTISFSQFFEDIPVLTQTIVTQVKNFFTNIGDYQIWQNPIIKRFIDSDDISEQLISATSDLFLKIVNKENIDTFIVQPIGTTMSLLRSILIFILSMIFILPSITRIDDMILRAFPGERGLNIRKIVKTVIEQIQKYVVAKSFVSLLIGSISLVICLSFRLKYALLWAFLIFILNFIPMIGSIIAVIFPCLMSLIQYQNLWHFIFITLCLVVAQNVIGYLVEPKVMSKGVNLSPIIILTALMIWGYVWGIVGVFLSVPIMATLNVICENVEGLKPISSLMSVRHKDKKQYRLRRLRAVLKKRKRARRQAKIIRKKIDKSFKK